MTPRIGLILLDHGEPPEYNAHTYHSFHNFAQGLITMGMIPKVVLRAKRGTILMDRNKVLQPNSVIIMSHLSLRSAHNFLFFAQAGGLYKEKTRCIRRVLKLKSGRRDSNPRQPAWKAGTLPTELLPQSYFLSESCEQFTKNLLDEFIKSRASGSSKKTLEIYQLTLGGFIGYPLTPEGINRYLDSLTCGNAKHNYYRCIKTLCRWLYRTDQLTTNPIEKVLPPRRQKRLLPAISKEQLGILVNHALTERDKVTLNLLWYSGMRLSEAASVKAKDFN